ncbi:hypothetical protein BDQ12DRAFT_669460 [Crucibulum laeve]|uniref:Uncharacterized protein n=1 Tax=Crucibulum laeve TaxID=68775 RepID=A0A5C3LNR2_9AGAR|nr:hypothetical protein BDQ12DRAFT_669460 [Crucibulum laeve]
MFKAYLKMSEPDNATQKKTLKAICNAISQRPKSLLCCSLFEDMGGMYSELIIYLDMKASFSPIGWLMAYMLGRIGKGWKHLCLAPITSSWIGVALAINILHPELIACLDMKVYLPLTGGWQYIYECGAELTLCICNECNVLDVLGSDIYTCKSYLTYTIKECIHTTQKGSVNVVVYFHKEGCMFGEFMNKEWYPDLEKYAIPDCLILPDLCVKINAKIATGYFSSRKHVMQADLVKTVGRNWEETEH